MAAGRSTAAAQPRDRQILAVAEDLFYERGFHAIGINEIAERTGVTGSAIYRYFESKDEILGTIFEEALDELFTRTAREAFESGDPASEFDFLVRTHATFVVDHPRVAIIMIRDETSLAPVYRRRHARRVGPYVERWIECLMRVYPECSRTDAATATSACLSLLNSVGHWPAEARRSAALGALLTRLVLHACTALEAPTDRDGRGGIRVV
jgi:AcrR family transcriptional regulator